MPRRAYSLETLLAQINAAFPGRNTASDGWLGDAAHAARVSQHNPLPNGVVCAIDITEDLSVGLNCNQLMEELDASNDPRIFYVIHDKQIDNSDDTRTPYKGTNPHITHLHISARWDRPDLYDNPSPWALPMLSREDDMSAADVKAITDHINIRIDHLAGWTKSLAVSTNAQIAALAEVVKQLADDPAAVIDLAAIEAVVEKGVADSIARIETTVTIRGE
jgi:hypothetical protein